MSNYSPFSGRRRELEALDRLQSKKSASLVVVRGRRRVGKSRLIEEFAKNKTFYHFTGLPPSSETTAQSQRDDMARQIAQQFGLPEFKMEDWHNLFSLLAKQTSQGPVIILLDEITWMGSKDPDFLGKLKNAWDLSFSKNPQLILILCGSISGWIEKNIISSTGFFGRISLKIVLSELSLEESNHLLNTIGFQRSAIEKLMLLAVTGGIPWYLEQVAADRSATENIHDLCFKSSGLLVEEFKQIFDDLFGRRKTIYKRIVKILAEGPAEFTQIAQKLDYQASGALTEYLEDLLLSGFISRDFSWHIKSGKQSTISLYRLSDNYLRFYLRSIEPNRHNIDRDYYQELRLQNIPNWAGIIGLQFENLILKNRHRIQKALKIAPEDILADNPYWQRKTSTHQGCQIDYLIQTQLKTLFACEIKLSRNEIGQRVIKQMENKLERLVLPKGFACLPVLIHANEVSDSVMDSDYFYKVIDVRDWLLTQ